MKHINKVAGYNLLGLVGYSILIRIVASAAGHSASDRGLGIIMFSAFAVGIHVLACIIVAVGLFIAERKQLGNAWLLTTGIVLVIGFSTCLGNAAIG